MKISNFISIATIMALVVGLSGCVGSGFTGVPTKQVVDLDGSFKAQSMVKAGGDKNAVVGAFEADQTACTDLASQVGGLKNTLMRVGKNVLAGSATGAALFPAISAAGGSTVLGTSVTTLGEAGLTGSALSGAAVGAVGGLGYVMFTVANDNGAERALRHCLNNRGWSVISW